MDEVLTRALVRVDALDGEYGDPAEVMRLLGFPLELARSIFAQVTAEVLDGELDDTRSLVEMRALMFVLWLRGLQLGLAYQQEKDER